jgi:hypothetical protein
VLITQWRKIFVGEPGVVIGLDQSCADGMSGSFDDVAGADPGPWRRFFEFGHVSGFLSETVHSMQEK